MIKIKSVQTGSIAEELGFEVGDCIESCNGYGVNDFIDLLHLDGEENLMSVMEELQADGLMNFTVQAGMVTSINGKANPADFSSCWMLYTSDAEMSNSAWGEIDYNGEKLGSAVLGADSLPVVEGEVYVWYYQAF